MTGSTKPRKKRKPKSKAEIIEKDFSDSDSSANTKSALKEGNSHELHANATKKKKKKKELSHHHEEEEEHRKGGGEEKKKKKKV